MRWRNKRHRLGCCYVEELVSPTRVEMKELRSLAMANSLVSILARFHRDEEGQGMVEYVLIISLVALAATAGMHTLASAINSAFGKVGSLLNSYV